MNTADVNAVVERARRDDGEAVARLLSRIIPPGLSDMSIWGSPFLSRYLAETLDQGSTGTGRKLFVLRVGSQVGGAVSLTSTAGGEIWCDALYVSPEARSGLRANLLLATALRAVGETTPGAEWIWLDAFVGNRSQDRWHDRMRCVEQERRGWWLGPGADGGESTQAGTVHGLPLAERQHAIWGFSMFDVETSVARYRVGRLPGPYFRIVLPEVPQDPELFAALRQIDSTRRVVVVGPESVCRDGWQQVAATRRLRSQYRHVLSHLDAMVRLSNRSKTPAGSRS